MFPVLVFFFSYVKAQPRGIYDQDRQMKLCMAIPITRQSIP